MRTIHIRTSNRARRSAIVVAPCIINLIVCVVFVATRPPATELLRAREEARRAGAFSLSSADPYMIIAERPLRNWSEWHGGESTWVKVAEVLNGPALLVTKRVGDSWSWRSSASYERDSWMSAYLFLALSSVQWLIVGWIIAKLLDRRHRSSSPALSASPGSGHDAGGA